MKNKWKLFLLLLPCLLCACTTKVVNYSRCGRINICQRMAIVPFANNTETPLAGERAMSITAGIIEAHGLCNLIVYKNNQQGKILFPGMNMVVSQRALVRWAESRHARYLITGSVNEWTYKVGLDGEPVVGVSMQVIDLYTGKTIWAGVGSQNGGSRTALSTVAQQLINTLVSGMF